MKFLDYLFHGKQMRVIDSYFKMLNGYSPTFTSFNGGVYEMDLTIHKEITLTRHNWNLQR